MSQETAVTGSFVWTFEDVKARVDALAPIGPQQRQFLFFFLITVVIVIAISEDTRKALLFFFSTDPLILVALLIVMLGAYLTGLYSRNTNLKKGFLQSPDSNKRIEVMFTQDEIVIKVEGVYENKWKWNVIKEVQQSPKGFCFFLAEKYGFWIPIRAFQSQEDIHLVTELAKRLTPKFKALG